MSSPDWRKALLPITATLHEAIQCVDKSSMQIAIVVSKDDVLVGTVTDGDIRRGILKGLRLTCSVESVINRDPFVVPPELPHSSVLQLMRTNNIQHLPVVGESGQVLDLIRFGDLLSSNVKNNSMVIMAGGKGSRLHPHTLDCPKPLLEVGGKPMMEHILDRAISEGFQNFIIAINYLGHMIEDYFGDGQKWGINISYLKEETALGTAGALSLLEKIPDKPLIVTNGDVLTDIRYSEMLEFHNRERTKATMAVRQHEWQNPFGVVQTNNGEIISFDEKPIVRSYINAGIYALDPVVLKLLQKNEYCDMPTLFTQVSGQLGSTIVYPIHEQWIDVGRPDDLRSARSK